jgi:hypothetical protein
MLFLLYTANLPLLLVLFAESLPCCSAGGSDQRCSLLLGFRFPLAAVTRKDPCPFAPLRQRSEGDRFSRLYQTKDSRLNHSNELFH